MRNAPKADCGRVSPLMGGGVGCIAAGPCIGYVTFWVPSAPRCLAAAAAGVSSYFCHIRNERKKHTPLHDRPGGLCCSRLYLLLWTGLVAEGVRMDTSSRPHHYYCGHRLHLLLRRAIGIFLIDATADDESTLIWRGHSQGIVYLK